MNRTDVDDDDGKGGAGRNKNNVGRKNRRARPTPSNGRNNNNNNSSSSRKRMDNRKRMNTSATAARKLRGGGEEMVERGQMMRGLYGPKARDDSFRNNDILDAFVNTFLGGILSTVVSSHDPHTMAFVKSVGKGIDSKTI